MIRLIYAKWRFLQFARKIFEPVLGRVEPLGIPRVPIDHFESNLREIGRLCSMRSIPAIFATEPSSHVTLGVPAFVVRSGYSRSNEALLDLISSYNERIRGVSDEREAWHLIDLDRAISARDDVGDIFTGDGFHFTESGLALVAEIESRFIETYFLPQAARDESTGRD